MKFGKRYRIGAESGVTLSGLIVVLIVLGALAVVLIRVTPALFEYRAVKDSLSRAKTEAASGAGVREIRAAFDKNADINDITAISGRDLVITREGDETVISFSYEKRIPLAGNVSLLFDFSGTTAPNGSTAKKADAADK